MPVISYDESMVDTILLAKPTTEIKAEFRIKNYYYFQLYDVCNSTRNSNNMSNNIKNKV